LSLVLGFAVDGLDAISAPIKMGNRDQRRKKFGSLNAYKGFVRCSNLFFGGIFWNSKDLVGFHTLSFGETKELFSETLISMSALL